MKLTEDFVLDASMTGSWAFENERTPLGEAVLQKLKDANAFVPRLWWFEVRNLLVMNERHGRITPEASAQFLSVLQLRGIIEDAAPSSEDVLRLARTHRLTVYDSAYLELALRLGVELATLDQRLATAARAEGLAVVGDSASQA